MRKKIAIVGGGPAGTSLAIRLSGFGLDVTLVERDVFPRQKLCGEFISPECLEHFCELGVMGSISAAGGHALHDTVFHSENGRSATLPSAWLGGKNALGLSRAEMDMRLLTRAKEAGVRVIEGASVTGLLANDGAAAGVRARCAATREAIEVDADITVDATGRAGILTNLLARSGMAPVLPRPAKPAYVGFKSHLRGASVKPGRCEMFFFRGGYGGVSSVEQGLSNLCFLVDAALAHRFKGNVAAILENIVYKNSHARMMLEGAEPVGDRLAVSIESFGRKALNPAKGLYTVGDAAAFIDPFTGSGMLLALESSQALASAIVGNTNLDEISRSYSREYVSRFRTRLLAASILRKAAFSPFFTEGAIAAASALPRASRMMARLTRQPVRRAIGRAEPDY